MPGVLALLLLPAMLPVANTLRQVQLPAPAQQGATEALRKKPPFAGIVDGGSFRGRGTLDDKSSLAASCRPPRYLPLRLWNLSSPTSASPSRSRPTWSASTTGC